MSGIQYWMFLVITWSGLALTQLVSELPAVVSIITIPMVTILIFVTMAAGKAHGDALMLEWKEVPRG